MSEKDAITLIERYLQSVARLSKRLAEAYEVKDLFVARNTKTIPRSGTFGENGEYQFHGIGCTIDDGSTSVNFDFFGDGRSDGFDAWRLHTFAEDNETATDLGIDTSRDALERAIKDLVESGLAAPIEGSNLFVLASRT